MKNKGFTLVELLIVIAILGILSVAVLTSINVVSNITKANLAKSKTFSSTVENALSINQVGKWSFNEGSGAPAIDSSGYTNNGTVNAGATWQTSDQCGLGFGSCLNFSGSGDGVQIPYNSVLNPREQVTISAWIKPQTGQYWFATIFSGEVSNIRMWIAAGSSGGDGLWWSPATVDGNNNQIGGLNVLTANQWNFITVTYNGQTAKIYLNGQEKFSNTKASPSLLQPFSSNPQIGYRGTGTTISRFKGLVDEVAIYSQALLASQIRELYAQSLPRHQLARN